MYLHLELFSSSDNDFGNLPLLDKTSNKPCCIKRAHIFYFSQTEAIIPVEFLYLYFTKAISNPQEK